MAKKFVRGITDVKTINNQDFDTNNVNDLLSDGQYNYIHRKKGKTEEYHNLTDNIKTLSSDNTELLTVTNNNKTTNTATLHPKHDAQKEQLLESTRDTVTIHHGENATAEKTTVDTNPEKVLEHTNLLTDYGISKNTTGNTTKLGLEYTQVSDGFDLNELSNGCIRGDNMVNAPYTNTTFFVEAFSQKNFTAQIAYHMGDNIPKFHRFKAKGVWSEWRKQVADVSTLDSLLAQKQDKLTAGDGLTIENNEIKIKAASNGNPLNNGFYMGNIINDDRSSSIISLQTERNKIVQLSFRDSAINPNMIVMRYRFVTAEYASDWRLASIDNDQLLTLLAQKQDVLTAGDGITIQGNTISASAPTSTIQKFTGDGFGAYKHVVQSGGQILTTFVFDCYSGTAEHVITGELKEQLKLYVLSGLTFSNGAITLTNDGTNIKLTNSNSTENVYQQGTFTFYTPAGGGGGFIS